METIDANDAMSNDVHAIFLGGNMTEKTKRRLRRAAVVVVIIALWKLVPPLGSGYTVSRETTYVTGPVDADGYVDYFAAHRELFAKDVTPETNAALAIMRAIDPADLPQPWYDAVATAAWRADDGPRMTDLEAALRKMRINPRVLDEPIPEKEPEPVEVDPKFELSPELKRKLNIMPTPTIAQRREAKAMLAAWLVDNDDAIDRIAEATKLPEFYLPPVPHPTQDRTLMNAVVPLGQLRSAANALRRRAERRIDVGDHEGAWRDVHALLRMGRLATRQPGSIGFFVGVSISNMAHSAMQPLIASSKLSPRTMLDEVDALPASADLVHHTLQGDRLNLLDTYVEPLYRKTGGDPEALFMGWRTVRFDGVARRINGYFDDLTAAAQETDWQMRRANADRLQLNYAAQLHHLQTRTGKAVAYVQRYLGSRSIASRAVSHQFGVMGVNVTAPAMSQAFDVAATTEGMHLALRAALACAIYRETHGEWPAYIDELTPSILETVPIDPCSNQPLRYRRLDDGFVVYSVGTDGGDQGGPPPPDVERHDPQSGDFNDDNGFRVEAASQ